MSKANDIELAAIKIGKPTLGSTLVSMLPPDKHHHIDEIAGAVCAACGGLPDGCACLDDFINSPDSLQLPGVDDELCGYVEIARRLPN